MDIYLVIHEDVVVDALSDANQFSWWVSTFGADGECYKLEKCRFWKGDNVWGF